MESQSCKSCGNPLNELELDLELTRCEDCYDDFYAERHEYGPEPWERETTAREDDDESN